MTQNKYFSYNDGVSYRHLFEKENAFIAPNKGMRIRSLISAAKLLCLDVHYINTWNISPIWEYRNTYDTFPIL